MQEKVNFEVIIPYFRPNSFFRKEQFDLAVNEITEIFDKEFFEFGNNVQKSKIKFSIKENIKLEPIYGFFIKDWYLTSEKSYLILSLNIKVNFELYEHSSKFTIEEKRQDLNLSISDQLNSIFYEIIFSANIARPGCISVFDGAVFVNGKKHEDTYAFSHLLQDACDPTNKIKYPEVGYYNITKIRQWIRDNYIDFPHSDLPKNKLSIALYCLTYVCSFNLSSAEHLIYSMIALEALYTKGNSNITEQLNEKIQIYLGSLNNYKKIIKDMYSLRSRFLHGDLPIKPIFMYDNTYPSDYEGEIYAALLISSRILIKTIQKMIIENRTELDFEYKLK